MCYNKEILKSSNKCKTTWDIKELSRKQHCKTDIQELMIVNIYKFNKVQQMPSINISHLSVKK